MSVRHAGDDSELPSEGSLPNNGRMNGFVPGSSAPAAFNAASFAAHMTRAVRAASAAAGSAGASPKAGAMAPQVFANRSGKRCAKTSLTVATALSCAQLIRMLQAPLLSSVDHFCGTGEHIS